MHLLHILIKLLFVAHVTAAAGLNELFIQLQDRRDIFISLDTRLCYIIRDNRKLCNCDLQQLGSSSVLGLKDRPRGDSLPVQDALDLLRADACPLNHTDLSVLVLEDGKLGSSKWVEHGASIHSSWSAAGILRGSDLVHAKLEDLCSKQVAFTRSNRRALQQQQQQHLNSTHQATTITHTLSTLTSQVPLVPTPTVLQTAGTVVGWGASIYERAAQPPMNVTAANSVARVVAGNAHAVALLKDGSVTVWGDDNYGQTNIPEAVQQGPVKAIAAGDDHSLALMQGNGTVVCWGNNQQQQCNVPAAFSDGRVQVVNVKATSTASFAQLSNGTWVGWGTNPPSNNWGDFTRLSDIADFNDDPNGGYNILLNNGTFFTIEPNGTLSVPIPALRTANITATCGGRGFYAMALDTNGTIWSWGMDGDTSAQWYSAPDNIQGKVKGIACGTLHALAELDDASIVAWGIYIPEGYPPSNVTGFSAGLGFSLYLLTDGNVLQSGGLPGPLYDATVPDGLTGVVAIAATGYAAVAMKQDGSVAAWGYTRTLIQQLPMELSINGAIAVGAGYVHALAVLQSGVVVQWGAIDADVPPEARPGGVRAVAAGFEFSLALTASGQIIAWAGKLACSTITSIPAAAQSNVVNISAGYQHALALLNNGTVVEWGCLDTVSVPATVMSGVIAISAGWNFSLALLQSGAVVAWGANDYHQTDVPSQAMANVTAISAGAYHSAALLKDGTVVSWGDNTSGQLQVPNDVQGHAMAIAAYANGTFAIAQPPSSPPSSLITPIQGTSKSSALSSGKIVGIAFGSAAAILIVAAIACIWHKRHHNKSTATFTVEQPTSTKPFAVDIIGLTPGEIFSRATAFEYSWCEDTATDAVPVSSSGNDHGAHEPIQLTKEDVKQQLLLVKNGLLGRGATALVFKCMWPNRFGSTGLLAAKVLKDGYELDVPLLQSFYYEATVLASFNPPHHNVVRLYGYCLEPPTVCLILELLPGSLKALIYKQPSIPPAATSSRQILTQQASGGVTKTHSKSYSTSAATVNSAACSTIVTISDTVGTSNGTSHSSNSYVDRNIQMQPETTSTVPPPKLSMLRVLQISIDIAAGLKYLHEMPLVTDVAPTTDMTETSNPVRLEVVQETDAGTSSDLQPTPSAGIQSPRTTKVVHRGKTFWLLCAAFGYFLQLYQVYANTARVTGIHVHCWYTFTEGLADISSRQAVALVTHADLKPANILIAADGTAKISDFGLARQQMKTTLLTDHLGAGTLPYMAPELLAGATIGASVVPPTNRVDIYSMAMIMWEMLAGRVPWSHLADVAMIAGVINGRRHELPMEQVGPITQPLSEIPASLNALPEFNAIIRACWNQREHRRPTAAALHEMLLNLLNKYQQ